MLCCLDAVLDASDLGNFTIYLQKPVLFLDILRDLHVMDTVVDAEFFKCTTDLLAIGCAGGIPGIMSL